MNIDTFLILQSQSRQVTAKWLPISACLFQSIFEIFLRHFGSHLRHTV